MDAAQLYRTQPNLRAVVSFLADNAAQVPIKVYERASDTDRPRVLDSPAALLLADPNPDMTAYEFKRWMYSDLLLYERFLTLILPSKYTTSGWELRPVPETWIQQYKGRYPFAPESIIIGVPGNTPIEIPADKFVLFHGYDPTDPMRQCSRIGALKETLHEQIESNGFRRQMWHKGGRFNAYLTRPKDVAPWSNTAFERFKETWEASWAGSKGSNAGGMPILEDGMEIKTVQFNSKDAQWAEAVKLSREDCAAVYHVNPAMIWPGSGQTYASAKDNARALYNDCLAPTLMQATDRINKVILPKVREPANHYAAYDITIKTEGTFCQASDAGLFSSAWFSQQLNGLSHDIPRKPCTVLTSERNIIVFVNGIYGMIQCLMRRSVPPLVSACGIADEHKTHPYVWSADTHASVLIEQERVNGLVNRRASHSECHHRLTHFVFVKPMQVETEDDSPMTVNIQILEITFIHKKEKTI